MVPHSTSHDPKATNVDSGLIRPLEIRDYMPETPYVLICDDDAHIRYVVAAKVRGAGLEVAQARDGQEGLELARIRVPRLVLTDFQMPRLSGLEMCEALKADPRTADVPVLMLTARGYTIEPERMAKTNIRRLIDKPFGTKQLLDTVCVTLGIELDPATGRVRQAA